MKKRTLNEYRQTKEYKLEALEELHQKLWGESYADDPSEYDGDTERDHIEEAKIEIVDKVTKHFQDYMSWHQNRVVCFYASDIVLKCHSDASYLTSLKARSRAGGHFLLRSLPIK